MISNIELKQCPFCDGETPPILSDYEGLGYGVVCTWCAASAGFALTPELAAELWNNRPVEDTLLLRLKIMRGELHATIKENGERMSLLSDLVDVLRSSFQGARPSTIKKQAQKALTRYGDWLNAKESKNDGGST